MDNDTRGWIMCIVSGIACTFGATIVCVDALVRLFPGKKDFRIQDSNAFLACSLSLSFGVMIFSALYSMLPSAMCYLAKAEWDRQSAGFLTMSCFIGGFVGIQIISRVVHQYMPSHIVDCDHTHKEHFDEFEPDPHSRHPSRASRHRRRSVRTISSRSMTEVNGHATEFTPLLVPEGEQNGHSVHPEPHRHISSRGEAIPHFHGSRAHAPAQIRRSSLRELRSFVKSFVKDRPHKAHCDESDSCYGYSEPCGQECDKLKTTSALSSRSGALQRTNTGTTLYPHLEPTDDVPEDYEDGATISPGSPLRHANHTHPHSHSHLHTHSHTHSQDPTSEYTADAQQQHHHHVPENAFLSIGLQTVIAIALHKFPEGFITYATNHASRSLGLNVFMALFVHNIAEGFSMALPLYLALGSRLKAVLWSSLLGGLSQPLGAAVAVLWFHIADNRSEFGIDNVAYACLFAVTAGIMTSVALQLFVESLSLNHNKNLSIFFAFLGMIMLGLSNALVTE
ncbi:Zinc/iron permease [Lasiosphaeria hispida]|uniref:Zinc/iron permease n=1 Tax=Lasiosphaeria hispida TaxID=260671 RepID=A0AAJ0HME1_9PEZI|nr:Zinc/iron permease [Lasiosphaeria hispida]